MVMILFTIGFITIVLVIRKLNLTYHFNKEVEQVFSQSPIISNKIFHHEILTGLPEPVQRYFRHILKEGQPYISYIRLKHNGQFKTSQDKEWENIKGEQYFTASKPGFVWKGTTAMFTARDMFIADKGRLVVSFFSVYNIVNENGKKIDQGELLRWLGESIWFPTNLLPSEFLYWTPIDQYTAKMIFTYNGLSLFYIVSFNEIGEITQLETKRFMGEESLETWIGKISNYKELNGLRIPTTIEAIWRLPKGDYSYAKFNVTELDYDIPRRF